MTETDAEFIDRMRALAEKATPGPWDYIQGGFVRAIKDDLAVPIFRSEAPIDWHKKQNLTHRVLCKAYADEANNAAFIAASRTAIPRLIGMVEERERDIDALAGKPPGHWKENMFVAHCERDAAIARAVAAESAQREAVAEVARLREALKPFSNVAYLVDYHAEAIECIDLQPAHFHDARAALASKAHPHD